MIAKYVIVAWLTLAVLLTVGTVGKPRKPTTPGQAAVSVAITAGLIVLVVVFWPTP